MEDIWQRIVENLFGRLDGPLHFRFIFQPLMAVFFAIKDGLKDAKRNKPPFTWALLTDPKHRRERLKDLWRHVGKIFIVAIILDLVYQLRVLHRIWPAEMIIVAFVLAVVPYLLLRGTINRMRRLFAKKTA
jgi:hypothetical protein